MVTNKLDLFSFRAEALDTGSPDPRSQVASPRNTFARTRNSVRSGSHSSNFSFHSFYRGTPWPLASLASWQPRGGGARGADLILKLNGHGMGYSAPDLILMLLRLMSRNAFQLFPVLLSLKSRFELSGTLGHNGYCGVAVCGHGVRTLLCTHCWRGRM